MGLIPKNEDEWAEKQVKGMLQDFTRDFMGQYFEEEAKVFSVKTLNTFIDKWYEKHFT